jgi:exopolysaccharide biosynthesis polyprenyl glycosylphosphotransferase
MKSSDSTSSPQRVLPTHLHEGMDAISYNYDYESRAEDNDARFSGTPSRASQRSAVLRRLLLTSDLAAGLITGVLTALIFDLELSEAAGLTATLLGFSLVLCFFFGLYGENDLQTWASGLSDAPRMIVAMLLLSWPLLGVASLMSLDPPVLIAVVATALMASTDSICRALARGWAHRIAPLYQRTVIVGSGVVADRLADRLDRHTEFGLQTVGLVDDDVHRVSGKARRLPKLGTLSEFDDVLAEQRIDRVIIAFSRASHQQLLSCIRTCRDHHVAVDVVPRLFELVDAPQSVNQIGGLPLLSIGAPPLNKASRIAKRGLDILISVTILTVLSPILLVVAVAIKLDSRGPIFFRQTRAGRGETEFRLIKFRSMYRDAEQRKLEFAKQNESTDGVMFKIKKDPRITHVGSFLRRSSLDEIPQLINVLKGEMSLVGPRPLILKESRHATDSWLSRRLDLRPGITGLWQISGRSDLPFQEMVRFDYQYVSGWSLARDIEILLATIPVVLSGRGAY